MDKETKAYLAEVRNSILDRVSKAAGKVIDGGNYLSDDRVLISLIDALSDMSAMSGGDIDEHDYASSMKTIIGAAAQLMARGVRCSSE